LDVVRGPFEITRTGFTHRRQQFPSRILDPNRNAPLPLGRDDFDLRGLDGGKVGIELLYRGEYCGHMSFLLAEKPNATPQREEAHLRISMHGIPERPLPPQAKEREHDKHGHQFDEHAAENRDRHWHHQIGATAR
jgi:hypothetical protein